MAKFTDEEKFAMFEEELNNIPIPRFRNWVKDCLLLAPEYFWEISASESMTHHPYWDLGPQGCIRHSRAVCKQAMVLLRSMTNTNVDFPFEGYTNDEIAHHQDHPSVIVSKVICACILHDSIKYGPVYDRRIFDMHPYFPRNRYKSVVGIDDVSKEWIFRAIEAHMGSAHDGEWSGMPYVTMSLFKKDPLIKLIHDCDMIVSNVDFIDKRFEHINKDVPRNEIEYYKPYSQEFVSGLVIGALYEQVGTLSDVFFLLNDGTYTNICNRIFSRLFSDNHYVRQKLYNMEDLMNAITENTKMFLQSWIKTAEDEVNVDS